RAIAFVSAIERAEHVPLDRPFNVVADEEVQPPIFVIVKPDSTTREIFRTKQSNLGRDVGKLAIPEVSEETVLTHCGNENIVPSIVVIITDRDALPEHRLGK